MKIEAFERKCLGKALRIFYPNNITSKKLMEQSKLEELKDIIEKRSWSYLGHILRRPNLSMAKELTNAFEGQIKMGRPSKNIVTVIIEALKKK